MVRIHSLSWCLVLLVVCSVRTGAALPEPADIVSACSPEASMIVAIEQGRSLAESNAGRRAIDVVHRSGLFEDTIKAWAGFSSAVGIEADESFELFFGGRVAVIIGRHREADNADEQPPRWVIATDVAPETGHRVRRRLEAMPRRKLAGRAVYTIADGSVEFTVIERADGRSSWMLLGMAESGGFFDTIGLALLEADEPDPGGVTGGSPVSEFGQLGVVFWRGGDVRSGVWEATADVVRTPRGVRAQIAGRSSVAPVTDRGVLPRGLMVPADVPVLTARVPASSVPGTLGAALRYLVGGNGEVLASAGRRRDEGMRVTIIAPVQGDPASAAKRADQAMWQAFGLLGEGAWDFPNHAGTFPDATRVQRVSLAEGGGALLSGRVLQVAWRTTVADDAAAGTGAGVLVVRIANGRGGERLAQEVVDLAELARVVGGPGAAQAVTEGEAGVRELASMLWKVPKDPSDDTVSGEGWLGVLRTIERVSWRVRHTEAPPGNADWPGRLGGEITIDLTHAPAVDIGGPSQRPE